MKTSQIPILLYHDLVSDECLNEKTGTATKGTVVKAEEFEAHLSYLKSANFTTISLADYFNLRAGKFRTPNPQKNIIITFDDGHISNYKVAFPLLAKFGFTATFFIISERVNQAHHLTASQIVEMSDAGMEIASHGHTHNYLPLLPAEEQFTELNHSKKMLEEITGKPVNFFAFPGGHYTLLSLRYLKELEYRGACSCLLGINRPHSNPFLLKRIEIRQNTSVNEFQRAFQPLNLIFYSGVDSLKRNFKRCIGLNNYINIRKKFYSYYPFKR